MHQKARIKGVRNLEIKKRLDVGTHYVGFMHKSDLTWLNIQGKLIIKGDYSIGRGCRIDIGKDACIVIGEGGYLNASSRLIIMHSLSIGNHCAISWDCQFLDDDFHTINYDGKTESDPSIIIGDNVWIGCGAKIYKGSVIPDGCVVASDSVVKGKFDKKNALIGGNPARIIKEDISWNWPGSAGSF